MCQFTLRPIRCSVSSPHVLKEPMKSQFPAVFRLNPLRPSRVFFLRSDKFCIHDLV